jgi:hypothetical protein
MAVSRFPIIPVTIEYNSSRCNICPFQLENNKGLLVCHTARNLYLDIKYHDWNCASVIHNYDYRRTWKDVEISFNQLLEKWQ